MPARNWCALDGLLLGLRFTATSLSECEIDKNYVTA
jgi:hypothetical protein